MIRRIIPAVLLLSEISPGQGLAALPDDTAPNDSRLQPPLTLDGYHPFHPVTSKEQWSARREEIVRRIAVSTGLWPHPTKTPLDPVIHRKIDQGDYTIEAVSFESMPGHFVTGSLYRPAGDSLKIGLKNGKRPGVLCPHGHWQDARYAQKSDDEARREIASGAERFLNAAKSIHQARCVQLARMGCVVFFYDMLGNGDSRQFLEHRHGPGPETNGEAMGDWGFVSKNASARLQTSFGLQTWNGIRSLDFLLTNAEVDPDRILVTGASGGATQTMMVSALDDRVTAAFPCVMVSTAMQGGCTCENAFYLRIGQGNVDLAATIAPRPLGLTAADDWTVELEEKGHPDLSNLYRMLGAKGNYEAHFDTHFKHNYNHVSRTHMYQFVNRHFDLGLTTPVLERDFDLLGKEELSVFDQKHPAPSGNQVGTPHEKALNRWWAEDSDQQISALLNPKTARQFEQTKEVIGSAVQVMIGRNLPRKGEVDDELVKKESRNGWVELSGLIRNTTHGEEIPASFLYPAGKWQGHLVIWLSPDGKRGIFRGGAEPINEVKTLLAEGIAVMSLDLFAQGDFLNSKSLARSKGANPELTYARNQNAKIPADSWQRSPVYYYGYNHGTFARRVHDVLTAVAFAHHSEDYHVQKISLVAPRGTGHWAAAARAIIGGDLIQKAWLDPGGFKFQKLDSHWHPDFLPGAVKYGDLSAFLVLNAPFDIALPDPNDSILARPWTEVAGGTLHTEEGLVDYLVK